MIPATTAPPATISETSLRLLGLAGMLGAPGLLVEVCVRRVYSIGDFQSTSTTNLVALVYAVGWMCSMIGLRKLRATGAGALSGVVFFLQVAGLCLAMCQQLIDLARVKALLDSPLYHLADTAWPLSHLFMLVVGIMVLVTRRLHGPLRFAPLGCGLALPLAMSARPFSHAAMGIIFGTLTTTCFAAQGLAVYLSARDLRRWHADH